MCISVSRLFLKSVTTTVTTEKDKCLLLLALYGDNTRMVGKYKTT